MRHLIRASPSPDMETRASKIVCSGARTFDSAPKPTGFQIKPRSRACRSMFVLARRTLSGYCSK
jgi:hypothetical protein